MPPRSKDSSIKTSTLPLFSLNHYNVLVWTSDESSFSSNFPKEYLTYPSPSPSPSPSGSEISFSFIPHSSYLRDPTSVIDCLLLIPSSTSDSPKISTLLPTYPKITIKLLLTPSPSTFPQLNIPSVPTVDAFFPEILAQYSKIEEILHKIFEELDTDHDGNIDSAEMTSGLGRLSPGLTIAEIHEYFSSIDLNHDSKVSFYEFSYWWRRGRQGGKSLKKISEAWAESIQEKLPKMRPHSEKLDKQVISKLKLDKHVEISFGHMQEAKLGLHLVLGSSGKREEILRDINNMLRLNIYECWIAFQVKFKEEAVAKENLRRTEEMLANFKAASLAGTIVEKEIADSINCKVVLSGFDIICVVYLDVSNDYIDQSLEMFKNIDKLFKSPTDDYIDIKVISKNNISELQNRQELDLGGSIEAGKIIVKAEHWAMFVGLIKPATALEEIIERFLALEGAKTVTDPDTSGTQSLMHYLNLAFAPIRKMFAGNQLASRFFGALGTDIYPELDVHLRYNNIGGKFAISCEDLSLLFTSQ